MESVRAFIAGLGAQRAAMMAGVALLLVAGLAWMATREGTGSLAYLYTDLDPQAAQAIGDKLAAQGVAYQLSGDGSGVMVPADRVAELRMGLAGEQLGGKIGYEVLDAEDAFGTSAAKAKINATRAIEGELSRSIESLTPVRRARVHIVMPERALFAAESRPATASVTLKTVGRLSSQQTDSIRYLVASAVPELEPTRISIVDQNGTLLARAGDGGVGGATEIEERQVALQVRLREQVETMLERIVGPGRVRAEVAAAIDASQVREEADRFDPDLQVVAKTSTTERLDESNETVAGGGAVSVATALPEADLAEGGDDTRRTKAGETTEETTYDNSRTRTTTVTNGGGIERLTVSVMVDGSYATATDGRRIYTPRTQAELDRFTRLVRGAIGYDEERGDQVVVENLRFAEIETDEVNIPGLPLNLTRDDITSVVRTLVLGILGLIALVLVVRPLLAGREAVRLAALSGPSGKEIIDLTARAAAGDAEAAERLQQLTGPRAALGHEIDVAQVEGRLKASAVRKVGELVEKSPAESAAIVRQWMYS